MKKIKIICGTYGFQTKNGMIIPVNNKHEPIILPDEKAQRLIDRKIAELIEDIPEVEKQEIEVKAKVKPEAKIKPAKKVVETKTTRKAPTKTKSRNAAAPVNDATEVLK